MNDKEILKKAISDFDIIEKAIEDCGVDVPYDTDTSEYGDKIKEVYMRGTQEGVSNITLIMGGDSYSVNT